MKYFRSALLHSVFKIFFSNRKDMIFTLRVLKKENLIYKRRINLQKVQSTLKRKDRLFLSLITKLSMSATNHLTIVKPSTLLDWQRRFIKNYWTYKHKTHGKRLVSKEIKDLILDMKRENQLWGCHKIVRIFMIGIIIYILHSETKSFSRLV